MDDLIFEAFAGENKDISEYLALSITAYGLSQLKGDEPEKLFCRCKNREGVLLGAIMGTRTLNLFFISHLYVEEKYRHQGIGGQLLAKIADRAKKAGCTILRLNTLNALSHHFYEKNGFTETTRIHDYMDGFDLVFYEKRIS